MFALEYDPEIERQVLREEAREETLLSSAIKLLRKGFSLSDTAQLLELSDTHINQLASAIDT